MKQKSFSLWFLSARKVVVQELKKKCKPTHRRAPSLQTPCPPCHSSRNYSIQTMSFTALSTLLRPTPPTHWIWTRSPTCWGWRLKGGPSMFSFFFLFIFFFFSAFLFSFNYINYFQEKKKKGPNLTASITET